MKKNLTLILVVLALVLGLTIPGFAADVASATNMRISSIEGKVTAKNASGKSVSTRNDMRLYNGYEISTEKDSYAYIKLDDSKAVKLDSLTKVSVKKNGKKLELQVVNGSLFFNVTEPLKKDENLNIRTTTMVTGIRGTSGLVSVRPAEIDLTKDGTAITKHLWDESVQLFTGKAVIDAVISAPSDSVISSTVGAEKVEAGSNLNQILGGSTKPETIESETITVVSIEAGETVISRSLGVVDEEEKYEVVKITTKAEDVPVLALEEIAKDEELQAEIKEQAPNVLDEDIEKQIEEAEAKEDAAAEAKEEKVEADIEADEKTSETVADQVFDPNTDADGGAGAAADDYVEPDPPAPAPETTPSSITLDNPTAQDIISALNDPEIKSITITNANVLIARTVMEEANSGRADNEDPLTVDIEDGKTVTLASGTLTLSEISSEVYGTLNVNEGANLVLNDGASIEIYSTNSVHVAGNAAVNGDSFIVVGCNAEPEVGITANAGLLDVSGTLTLSPSADLSNNLNISIQNGEFKLSGTLRVYDVNNPHDLYIFENASAVFSQNASVVLGNSTDNGNDVRSSNIFVHGKLETACGYQSDYSIVNYGTTIFNDGYVGTITNRGLDESEETTGSLTIKNGNVDMLWNEAKADTVQTGGTVKEVANNSGTYTVSGGELGFATNNSTMTISGGVLKGDFSNKENPNAVINFGNLVINGSIETQKTIENSSDQDKNGRAQINGQITYTGTYELFNIFANVEFGSKAKLIVPKGEFVDQMLQQHFVSEGAEFVQNESGMILYIDNDARQVEEDGETWIIDFSKEKPQYYTVSFAGIEIVDQYPEYIENAYRFVEKETNGPGYILLKDSITVPKGSNLTLYLQTNTDDANLYSRDNTPFVIANGKKISTEKTDDQSLSGYYKFELSDISENVILTPEYPVVYDIGDGEFAENASIPVTYVYGVGVSLPGEDSVILDGSIFVGWLFDDEIITEISSAEAGPKYLVAQWK